MSDGVARIRNQSMEEVMAAAVAEEEEEEEGVLCVKVMTDEQMEVLRTQISAYATICEQLVQMHRARQQDCCSPSGMLQPSSLHNDPSMSPGVAKFLSRQQRWNPTPTQLQILESIFYHGNGTPSKETIKDITCQLSQHGQISDTSVYNWFQNRRARSKRKQTMTAAGATSYDAESEAEIESPSEKKARLNTVLRSDLSAPAGEHSLQCSDVSFGSEGMRA